MRLTLTVTEGPHEGRTFAFTEHDTFVVGRAPAAHFSLADKDRYFSRHHFLIEVNPPLCRLVDLQSHNHTYVNGDPVQTRDLRDGDRIKAGHTVLRVSLEPAADETAPPPEPPAWEAAFANEPAAAAAVSLHAAAVGWEASAVVGTLRDLQLLHWRQGLRLPVEAYLERWPSLAANAEGVLELIYGEYCLREQAGERPRAEEFQRRFPQHAVALERQLVLHDALVGPSAPESLPAERAAASRLPRIPGYRVEHELGRGAMGVVYRAQREDTGETVAIKTILPAARPRPTATARFLREADILRRLSHPHIVAFRALGEADGLLYFVTDYVAGKDAGRIVRETGPMAIERAVGLTCQLLEALAHAHAEGFVHRDIKPSNLLVTEENGREVVKLADFGLARAYQASPLSGLTMVGGFGGTPAFMPPEQILNFRDAQPAADQYSAAATLYYLLTAAYPHDPAPTTAEMFKRILEDDPVPIRTRRADVPQELADAIHRAMERNASSRPTHADAMRIAMLVQKSAISNK